MMVGTDLTGCTGLTADASSTAVQAGDQTGTSPGDTLE
jgi:hypothetical protein